MAYITDYTYASDDADVSSHTGILSKYNVGDLLLWIVHKDSTAGSHLETPSGWTALYAEQGKNEEGVFYKFAEADETAPSTSSDDTDAYQSAMFTIKGADQDNPLSSKDNVINGDTYAYSIFSYYQPPETAVGNIHFCFLSSSGVGGASIENFGKRYINDESTSVAMVIHAKTLYNTTQDDIGAAHHTSCNFVQFEVVDDGNNIGEPICENDLDIIELAVDKMVNGSTLGDSSLTTLNGLDVVAGTITESAGDVGFYPLQKAPYLKGVKGLQYTAMELSLADSVDLSQDLLVFSAYPYKPKYQPTIGRGTQGRFIYIMDANSNYKAFNIDAADNKLLNFAMQWSYAIDPTAPAFASSGTVDLTAITKIGFGERSRSIICYLAFNRIYRYRKSTIIGGNTTLPSNISTLLEYQNGSYFRPNLLQGTNILVQFPIEIGDGNIDIFFKEYGKTLEFPSPYNSETHDYLFHQNPNRSGINFNLTADSTVEFDIMVFESESEWYFTASNTNGVINIKNTTIRGSGNIVLASNMIFDNVVFDKNTLVNGNLNINNSFFSNPKDDYLVDLSDITTFRDNKINNYNNRNALFIPASITAITLDNIVFDGSGTDIYWAGSSDTLTVNCINGSNASTSSSAGGAVDIQNTKTFTFTLNPAITDYEWRLYEVDNTGSLSGAVELAGEESSNDNSNSYSYNYTADKTVALQILSEPNNDYEEWVGYYTLSDKDQSITVNLVKDENN